MTGEVKKGIRLNKYISEAGICSRREADRLIEAGKVTVEGEKAVAGMRILPGQCVRIGKKQIGIRSEKKTLLLVHKPPGIVCTSQNREKNNIIRFLNYPKRLMYAGRLDKGSRGLILMTDDGELINDMMRAAHFHEKEYCVRVDRPVTSDFLRKMSGGVPILDTVTRPCRVERTGKYTFSIVLTQGLNRQIRRMCETLGYEVEDLFRVRIMNLRIDGLAQGAYRLVTEAEESALREILAERRQDKA